MAKTTGAEPTTPIPAEPATEPAAPVTPEPIPTEPAKDVAWWESKAKAFEHEKEVAFKKLKKFEDAEQQRTEAEKTDLQKALDRAEEAELKAAEAERKMLCQKIAAEVGLPAIFAERLQGDDEEAMRADAVKLLEALPKQPETAKKQNPIINPTNPSITTGKGETNAERRERLGLPPHKG